MLNIEMDSYSVTKNKSEIILLRILILLTLDTTFHTLQLLLA